MKITTPRPRSREIFVIAALALLRMGACSDPVPPTPSEITHHAPTSPSPIPLTVDVFGCVDLRVDGVCMLPSTSRSLCFWIADISSDTKLTIQTTTILPITRQDEFDKGQMRCVDIPEDAASVTVHAGDQYLPKVYQLTTEETCEAVNKAKKRRKESQGNKTAAIADIRRILADHSMISPYCTAAAKSLDARLYLDENKPEEAILRLTDTAAGWATLNHPGPWVRDTFALANTLITSGRRYHDAYNVLHDAAQKMSYWAEMSAKSKYYLAILFLETGDIRSSLELVEETIPIFRHLGMTTMENDSVDVQAQILAFLGRQAEAENLRTQHLLRIVTPDPCMTGHWNNNSAWDRLMLREQQGTATTPDPRPLLLKAADIFAGQCATRRNWWRANIFVNLALAETQLGNLDAAEGYLTAARLQGETLTGSIAEWAKEIEARIALARGDLDRAWQLWCSSAWDTGCLPVLADTAQTTIYGESSSEIFILALLGRAQIVLLRADSTTAERLLLIASNHLEEQSAYVPLGEGKSTFMGSRSKVSRTLADLYIQLDRKDDAAWELRRANAQILGVFQTIDSLDGMTTEKRRIRMERLQRYHQVRAEAAAISAELQLAPRNQIAILQRKADDAKRTATRLLDELASDQKTTLEMANRPPPGELWLLLAPIGTTWGAIWQWETQSLHIPLPDLNTPVAPETLADILFAPVATVLETTNHLRITSIGAATGIDVHVLPWNNAPLQNQLVVDYWVPGAKPTMELPSTGKPLVIADPGENLRFARQFGEQVTKQWKVSGPAPDVLRGENATREVVLNKLPLHSTLVYAGHARKGGLDGRNAAILLAHDTELSAADLVTHQPLPQMVVLSACEAAESQPESIAPGPGMAQAFLLGGSRMVIASVRPVDDRCAGLWTEWLLERWTQSTEENLWEAYLSATEKMRGQEPRCDYGMFRVYRTPVM